jgi:hypothetical protein
LPDATYRGLAGGLDAVLDRLRDRLDSPTEEQQT